MTTQFECSSVGAPVCRVLIVGQINSSVKSAYKKVLKPHSIGDVTVVKDVREHSGGVIKIKLEFNPRELVVLHVFPHDRFFCESCQIPNDPIACEVRVPVQKSAND
jgi:hypothetical protein